MKQVVGEPLRYFIYEVICQLSIPNSNEQWRDPDFIQILCTFMSDCNSDILKILLPLVKYETVAAQVYQSVSLSDFAAHISKINTSEVIFPYNVIF